MVFKHVGLYFTEPPKHTNRSPLKEAVEYLQTTEPDSVLAKAQWYGLRYRLLEDQAALQTGVGYFQQAQQTDTLEDTLVLAQCFELLREAAPTTFLDLLSERVTLFNGLEMSLLDSLWRAALNTAAGIVLEDHTLFENGVNFFRQTIDNEVHPEGYLTRAVELQPEAVSLRNQIRAAQALVLIAEMARNADVDLWRYEHRGVSVRTAVTYPLYYYFYPEKWQWNGEQWKPSDGVEEETAKAIFKEHAGFLEMAHDRYDKPLKAISMILDDIRPVYDLYGGGLVTLTHAHAQRRGLFGFNRW